MQTDIMSLLSSSSDIDLSVEAISRGFNQQFDLNREEEEDDDDSKSSPDLHVADEDNHDDDNNNDNNNNDDDDDDNFTFLLVGDDESENIDGEIRPVFPLFDQKLLLLDGEYEVEEIDTLPVQPPVDKIFIHSPRRFPDKERGESNDETTGDYCAWSKKSDSVTAELSKKSNSTGFSRLWRLKERGGRSNSYGRDAFVFFRGNERKTTEATTSKGYVAADKSSDRKTTEATISVAKGKARVVKKAKKSNVSAHEAYLKSKEEERRRSYLPYRPELMGFFTNVHGGLTKNVHPY